MRRIVLLIIIICSTLSLVACADLERQEIKTQFSFAFIYPDCPEDWKETSDGAEKCIEDFNNQNREITIDVQFSSADGAIEQSEILSRFLNIGIDGICIAMPSMQLIYPYDNDEQEKEATTKYNDYETAVFSLAELIKKGIDLDIPIITIGHDQYPFSTDPQSQDYWGYGTYSKYMEQPSRICFIGSDNLSLGRKIAQKAMDVENGQAKIYGLGGWRHCLEEKHRRHGIEEVVSENVEKGAELVDGNWVQDSHFYPFDVHLSVYDEYTGALKWGMSCFCEDYLKESIGLMENERIELNTYIGLWKGSNAISNVFREKGWDDADTNKEHFSILCGESPEVIIALKEHFATCVFLEDRYEWGYQAVKTLIEIACQRQIPESDHIYTPSYIVDLSEVYDYFPDGE